MKMTETRPLVFLLAIIFLFSKVASGQRAILELPQEVETNLPNSSTTQNEEEVGFNHQTNHESTSSKSDITSAGNLTEGTGTYPTTSQSTMEDGSTTTSRGIDQTSQGHHATNVAQMTNSSTTAAMEQNTTTNDPAFGNITTELPLLNGTFPELLSPNETLYLNDTGFDANETDVTEPSVEEGDQKEEEEGEEVEEALSSQPSMYLEDFCSCDLTSVSCDIGCCCDPDCSPEDTRAFTTCRTAPRTLSGDPRYCSQHWTGLRHNTEYRLEQVQGGLLCIQTDNRPQRNTFKPLKIVRTRKQFEEVKEALPSLATLSAPVETEPVRDPAHYQQGDKVWAITRQGNFVQLGLPSSLLGRECDTIRPLSYLNNARTFCTRRINLCSPSSGLGPQHYVDFLVVTRPARALRLNPKDENSRSKESTTPEVVEDSHETTTAKLNPYTTTPMPSVTETYSEVPTTGNLGIVADFNDTLSHLVQNGSVFQNETKFPGNNSSDIPKILANLESSPNFALLKEKYFLLNSSYLVEVQIQLCREVAGAVECQQVVDIDEFPLNIGCGDVVSRVDYVITHKGTHGIRSVLVKMSLTSSDYRSSNLKTSHYDRNDDSSSSSRCDCDSKDVNDEENLLEDDSPESYIKQSFSVKYQWFREGSEGASDGEVVERSGRPGYIKGKPLLLGSLVKNTTQEGYTLEAISTDSDPHVGLTILKGGAGGLCQERMPVTFGDNIRSVCSLMASEEEASEMCDQLRERILEELLGPALGDVEVQLRVASYGDSSLVRPVEWVPLLRAKESLSEAYGADLQQFSEEGRCTNLVLSIRLEVAYALQGSLAHPQAKVIGCLLTTGSPQLGPPTGCYGPLCKEATFEGPSGLPDRIEVETLPSHFFNDTTLPGKTSSKKSVTLELTSTVVFIDMTQPSEPVFPDPPSLDLKLPYDFFYPYLPSNAVKLWHANTDLPLLSVYLVGCLHRIIVFDI